MGKDFCTSNWKCFTWLDQQRWMKQLFGHAFFFSFSTTLMAVRRSSTLLLPNRRWVNKDVIVSNNFFFSPPWNDASALSGIAWSDPLFYWELLGAFFFFLFLLHMVSTFPHRFLLHLSPTSRWPRMTLWALNLFSAWTRETWGMKTCRQVFFVFCFPSLTLDHSFTGFPRVL